MGTIGLDNSMEQIKLAEKSFEPNIDYILSDIMLDELPCSHIVIAPFVLGYCNDIDTLRHLCTKIYNSIYSCGRFVGVIDLPSGENLKKFGATKILHKKERGSEVEIILSDGSSPICTLWATYFSPETITSLLAKIDFQNIQFHKPIISDDGLREMPRGYWDGYIDNSELVPN